MLIVPFYSGPCFKISTGFPLSFRWHSNLPPWQRVLWALGDCIPLLPPRPGSYQFLSCTNLVPAQDISAFYFFCWKSFPYLFTRLSLFHLLDLGSKVPTSRSHLWIPFLNRVPSPHLIPVYRIAQFSFFVKLITRGDCPLMYVFLIEFPTSPCLCPSTLWALYELELCL